MSTIKQNLKSSINSLFVFLFIIVSIIWILYYLVISDIFRSNTESRLEVTSSQIIDNFENEFVKMVRFSYNFANSELSKDYVSQTNPVKQYESAQNLSQLLLDGNYNPDFVSNLVIYNANGDFFRLAGTLSNASINKANYFTNNLKLPSHFSIDLEGSKYIGFAVDIPSDNINGKLVIFTDTQKILDIIDSLALSNFIFVGIAAENKLIVTSNTEHKDKKVASLYDNNQFIYFTSKQISITPFEIIVAADILFLNYSRFYFSIAATFTAIVFIIIFSVFIKVLRKMFFTPMLNIIKNVETLDVEKPESKLPSLDNQEFDKLINKINEMLKRIAQKNEDIFNTNIKLKNYEIEKQKAIIYSLKKQINAHFTVNSLNAIKILIQKNNLSDASLVVDELSTLIQYAYDKNEFINIWDEFSMLDSYIDIMNVRHNNKLSITFDIDDRLMNYEMPRMILQPLIENAIIHGFESMTSNCLIKVNAILNEDNINICINDNGKGFDEGKLEELILKFNEGLINTEGIENIALINIKQRLFSYYGDKASISIKSKRGKGSEITIRFTVLNLI